MFKWSKDQTLDKLYDKVLAGSKGDAIQLRRHAETAKKRSKRDRILYDADSKVWWLIYNDPDASKEEEWEAFRNIDIQGIARQKRSEEIKFAGSLGQQWKKIQDAMTNEEFSIWCRRGY